MGRLPSWLVVAAVGILLALAAADAIRSTGSSTPEHRSQPGPSRPRPTGLLVISGSDCSVTALRLPTLTGLQPPRAPDCGGAAWSDDGTLVAECNRGLTRVVNADGQLFYRVRGCAAAWRPDGSVGVIHGGDLVLARSVGRPFTLTARTRLVRNLSEFVQRPATYRLFDFDWIDLSRFAGLVRGARPWEQAAVIATTDGPVEMFAPEYGQHISSLVVSPLGTYLAFARNRLGREFLMLTQGGVEVALPRIANARAIAWSPDERWVALATRTSTFIARTGTREVAFRVPQGGDSLAWLP
jgi:hypothetical protein